MSAALNINTAIISSTCPTFFEYFYFSSVDANPLRLNYYETNLHLTGLTYEQYHSYWTGIAEIGGGILLIMGRFGFIVPSIQIPAALLFLLVAAATPANNYMFTHDPDVPRIPPLPYPWGHAARGTLQVLLLAVFWKWANMP